MSNEIRDAYDLVPAIGNGYRWYDWLYRFLWWLLSGWRRTMMPRKLRIKVGSAANWLHPFNEHQRNGVWSRENLNRNLFVPSDEHVNVAGLWVVELFPPTDLPALESGLARNGWVRNRISMPGDGGNQETLSRARAGHGMIWWRLAHIVDWNSTWLAPDGFKSKLPSEFTMIELRAQQVGPGLTAVVAEFKLADEAAARLDVEWRKESEPELVPASPRWRALNRQAAAYRRTQTVRRDMHDTARRWLGTNLPGFFRNKDEAQPVLDLLLFDKYDPTALHVPQRRDEERKVSDALRALGLQDQEYYQATSPDLPKLVLSPLDRSFHEWMGGDPTWTLWGSRDAVLEALGDDELRGYGMDSNRAIAARLGENMYNIFVMLAVSEWLRIVGMDYATLRDRASTLHGRFKPAAIRQLRRSLLTLSLNLSTVESEVRDFWNRAWRGDGDAAFTYRVASRYRQRQRSTTRAEPQPIDFNANLRRTQEAEFKRLVEADRAYRDILSTVASLGASADSYKLGRFALWVAIASLAVALSTLLLSEVGGHSVLGSAWAWISGQLSPK